MKAETLYMGAGLHLGIVKDGDRVLWRDTVHCASQKRALARATQELWKRQRPPEGGPGGR